MILCGRALRGIASGCVHSPSAHVYFAGSGGFILNPRPLFFTNHHVYRLSLSIAAFILFALRNRDCTLQLGAIDRVRIDCDATYITGSFAFAVGMAEPNKFVFPVYTSKPQLVMPWHQINVSRINPPYLVPGDPTASC